MCHEKWGIQGSYTLFLLQKFRSLTKALAAELGRQQPDDSEHQGKRSFFR